MFAKYNTYKEEDFLVDEYFIRSMIEPTSESDVFWKQLIDEGKVDVNEFISAFMTFKQLNDSQPDVPADRIDAIWEHIVEANLKKESKAKRTRLLRYAITACGMIAILLSIPFFHKYSKGEHNQSIADFANKNRINTRQSADQIQLIAGKNTIDFNGTEVNVEYDKNGQLSVNQQTVDIDDKPGIEKEQIEYSQLRVPYGKRAFLKLSDGTSLWVNSGTTVIYPSAFAKNKREIYVEGEIFADVYHDQHRPFIVSTSKIDVQVLGTTFNVSAYEDDKQTNVVLVEGLVKVRLKNGKTTLIKPNQLFTYTDQASTLKEVDVGNYISWRDGKYIFQNEPIENILLRLSRYYNVAMVLPSSASGITCSGKLELKEDLNRLLNGLTEITSMSYALKDNKYRIRFERTEH